jgi:hypothetical protein
MRLSPSKRSRRTLIASIMLVAFALRALVPTGFMPASDRPFSIEICWEGFPAEMLAHGKPPTYADSVGMHSMGIDSMLADSVSAHSMPADSDSMHREPVGVATSHRGSLEGAHRHSGSPSHSEHCLFGSACSAGPILHLLLPSDTSSAQQLRAVAFLSIADAVRLVHLPQPRAPPGRLS